jgi:hypothetical protein
MTETVTWTLLGVLSVLSLLLTGSLVFLITLVIRQNQTLTNLVVSGDPLVFSTLQQTISPQEYDEEVYLAKDDVSEALQYEKLTGDKDDDSDLRSLGLTF